MSLKSVLLLIIPNTKSRYSNNTHTKYTDSLLLLALLSVKVNFEDKHPTGAASVVMDVNPNITCLAMKQLVG